MRKMPEGSSKKDISPPSTKDGTNKRRRKNKGQDETTSQNPISNVRPRRSKKKVLEPEGPRVFDVKFLRDGDKFTFLAPGKGKKTYVCTVQGEEVLFERNDKHTYTRHLHELSEIVRSCSLECTLVT
jgi:hypothetical protein